MDNETLGRAIMKIREESPEEKARREALNAQYKAEEEKRIAEAARLAVPKEIEKLRKEADEKIAEAERLGRLLAKYPDLTQHSTRAGWHRYSSKSVNGLVDKLSFTHTCSCGRCNDSPLDVYLHIETPEGPIYSEPPNFYVGIQESLYGGDLPRKGWQADLRAAGVSETVIDAVKEHFRKAAEEIREQAAYLYDSAADEDESPI